MSLTDRVSTACLPLAPALLFAYGAVRLLDPTRSPGVVWTVSHVFYLASYPAVGAAAYAVRRLLADASPSVRRLGSGLVALGWLGALCGIGQAVIDLVAGALASTKAERGVIADQLRDAVPGAAQLFYGPGPALSALAVIGLMTLAAWLPARRVPWWSPVLALGAWALPTLSLDLIPVAALGLLVALWPPYRILRAETPLRTRA